MSKRLTESFRLQMQATRKKARKERQEKQLPTFKNLEIPYSKVNDKNITILVSNIMDMKEKNCKSLVLSVKAKGQTYIINSIRCPICQKPIPYNEKWNSFVCDKNEVHDKKIYEILQVL